MDGKELRPADDAPRKPLVLNSIKNPSIRRILKPCEARGGHGFIQAVIMLGALWLVIAGLIKGVQFVYRWITGP